MMNKGVDMNANFLVEVGECLMCLAKKEGATDAIVSLSSGVERSVSVRDGILANSSRTQSAGFSLTAVVGERRGSVEFSSFISRDLEIAARRAVSLARVATKNPHLRLPDPSEWPCAMSFLPRSLALLDAYDSGETPTLALLRDRALTLDSIARSERGVSRSDGASFGHSIATDVHLMSNGFCAVDTYTHHQKSTSVIAELGSEMKTAGEDHTAFHFDDLRQ
jgi:PmbA protein